MPGKFTVYRRDGAWAWELRNPAGRVVIRRTKFTSIDAAIAEVDALRRAPIIVASMPRATKSTTKKGSI